jgi:hypothetical protein
MIGEGSIVSLVVYLHLRCGEMTGSAVRTEVNREMQWSASKRPGSHIRLEARRRLGEWVDVSMVAHNDVGRLLHGKRPG